MKIKIFVEDLIFLPEIPNFRKVQFA